MRVFCKDVDIDNEVSDCIGVDTVGIVDCTDFVFGITGVAVDGSVVCICVVTKEEIFVDVLTLEKWIGVVVFILVTVADREVVLTGAVIVIDVVDIGNATVVFVLGTSNVDVG